MSAIFGFQTCSNELVGEESELAWKNIEPVVGPLSYEIFQYLPGIRM